MSKIRSFALALAGLAVIPDNHSEAEMFQEDFSTDPAADGWKSVGDSSLFHWNATDHNLQAAWDSSRSNSYFALPLGTILAKDDDFSVAFDLRLNDFAAGINPQKPNPFQLSV